MLEEVAQRQEEVVVIRDGEPLAKVIPATWPAAENLPAQLPRRHRTLEELRGSVTILGDIVEPLDDWDVMK